MKLIQTFSIITPLLAAVSCSSIYGIKNTHAFDTTKLKQYDSQYHIINNILYYPENVAALQKMPIPASLKKDLSQPLQFWVMADDRVLANKVNCYANGFPDLKWNLAKCYENKQVYSEIKHGTAMPAISGYMGISTDTTIVVAYSYFMGRQNKRFLRECKVFVGSHPTFRVQFINMDNVYAN